MSAVTTLIGNTTADIEIRFTSAGKAVGSVTIAVSDRVKDADGSWKDGKTWFARCTLWGEVAENAAATISKGTRVIGFGRIEQRDWQDKDGQNRSSVEVTLDEIGPSLRYAVASVSRKASDSSANRSGSSIPASNSSQTAQGVGEVWDGSEAPF